jgi:hypothetical protein
MKNAALLLLSFLFVSCGSQKNSAVLSGEYIIESPCPADGLCAVEVLKDKSLLVINDDLGRVYYKLEDTPGRIVIKYTFKKDTDAAVYDGSYSEEVVFETDTTFSNLNNAGTGITKTKMLFGVMCFCRGKAGHYIINEGTISYRDKKLHITLPDVIDNQKIKTVSVTFK